ncbi:MAG TPA: hypothetical protein VGT60_13035 [Candidatus Limnocylindria bacterium]|nr:hypothetical protein [Candidatus Limnocylindria bacterium]
MSGAPIVLRAELTKSIGPGMAYLLTRLYLADGTILEQTNPGLPDVENGWTVVGREADLAGAADRLASAGWAVTPR